MAGRGRRGTFAAAAAALVLSGTVTLGAGLRGHDGPPGPPETTMSASPTPSTSSGAPATTAPSAAAPGPDDSNGQAAQPAPDLGPVLPASAPVRVDAPAIGLDAGNLEDLVVGPDGVLPAPVDYGRAGWWTAGPTPGQLGPAVIAGHVDGPDGPAVFYRLGQLAAGEAVDVTRADGTVAHFVVDRVQSYAKAEFPTSEVYGGTSRAELRLITCGGAFDRSTGHYVDNIVVFAHLVA